MKRKFIFLLKSVEALCAPAVLGIFCVVVSVSGPLLGWAFSGWGLTIIQIFIAAPLIVAEEIPTRAVLRSAKARCFLFYWEQDYLSVLLAYVPFMIVFFVLILSQDAQVALIVVYLYVGLMAVSLVVRIVFTVMLARCLYQFPMATNNQLEGGNYESQN